MPSRVPSSVYSLRITEIAFGGRGIGRLADGQVVFVPFVAAGETVTVQTVRRHKGYLEARLVSVDEASTARVEPRCPYFGRCGGCSYQHLTGDEQRRIKQEQVAQVLRRIGKFREPPVSAMVASPVDYEYRNRITVHVRDGAIGFFGQDARELVDVAQCPIAEPAVNRALAQFRAHPYLREGHCTLRNDNRRRTFHQTNDAAAVDLLRVVARFAEQGTWRHLIDAYCGAGFFARHLRTRFETVTGLERDPRAVEEARKLAGPHESYVAGDVGTTLADILNETVSSDTLLIVDPPAEGLSAEVRRAILERPPGAVIYVSCEPSTLARDLAQLANAYELISVTPLDMFPQTAQIETISFLRAR